MGTRRAAPSKEKETKGGTVGDRNSIWPSRPFRASDLLVLDHADGYPLEIDFAGSPILEFYLKTKRKRGRFRGCRMARSTAMKRRWEDIPVAERNGHLAYLRTEEVTAKRRTRNRARKV